MENSRALAAANVLSSTIDMGRGILWDMEVVGPSGLEVHYLPVYWACGPNWKQGSTRGGEEVFIRGDCVDE